MKTVDVYSIECYRSWYPKEWDNTHFVSIDAAMAWAKENFDPNMSAPSLTRFHETPERFKSFNKGLSNTRISDNTTKTKKTLCGVDFEIRTTNYFETKLGEQTLEFENVDEDGCVMTMSAPVKVRFMTEVEIKRLERKEEGSPYLPERTSVKKYAESDWLDVVENGGRTKDEYAVKTEYFSPYTQLLVDAWKPATVKYTVYIHRKTYDLFELTDMEDNE